MARERFDLNCARRTPGENESSIFLRNTINNSLEDDPATLSNVWDEEHDALNMAVSK